MINVNQEKLNSLKNEQARNNRAKAFSKEFDPLVGKYLRGEIQQSDLIEKADEIRGRYIYQD
ncbi:MAG: hypothetical protein AABY68_06170 [Pseudomonadota bacterium]